MKILLAESRRFPQPALQMLRLAADVEAADLQRRELLSRLDNVEVLWVRLRNKIDGEVFERAPRLRVVATPTTGLNHIDLPQAERRNVAVFSLRGEIGFLQQIRATAELTLGLILSLTRRIPPAAEHVRAGNWDRYLFRGNDLYGKTAGVIGYGRLGRIVADYLQALGMNVMAASPGILPSDVAPGVVLAPLDEVLRKADLVTLHVNLCPETQSFFGHNQFQQMKRGAWFINTSRGELVDEQALLESLSSGTLAGAAVDVVSDENSTGMIDHPLVQYSRDHDNLLITPHIGGNTAESLAKAETFLAKKVVEKFFR